MSNVARLWIHSMAVGVFLPPCTSPIVYARCRLGEALVQDWCFVCFWLVRPWRQVGIDAISRLLA